jgi:pimeloyl-ACP methyl ester carboxylesterase
MRTLVRCHFSKVFFHKGAPSYVANTKDVNLRGVYIKGRYSDLPNMLFFPEACDPVESWLGFFSDPDVGVLDYRNVYVLSPRNFGKSDRHSSFDLEDVANDVLRFMWKHKLTTATLAGHGYGAKVALAAGCYNPERVTGVFAVDSSPMNHSYHEAFREFKTYVDRLYHLDMNRTRTQILKDLRM